MSCFGMGLKEKIKSGMRRMSNASSASHTSDSANTESTTATDITPSKKASRLHDVAGSAKVTNSGLEAEDDTAASVADSAKADNTELEAEDSINPAESVAGAAKVERPGLKTQDSVDTAVSVAPAVTHEVVRPQQHEEIEEQISREIHTHEVHQKIQPIFDVEVRPVRHLVDDENGGLVEVSEEQISNVYRAREAEAKAEGKGRKQASSKSEVREAEPTQRRYNLRSGSRQP